MNRVWFVICSVLIFCGCKKEERLFNELSESETGISFSNRLNESDSLNILDYLYFYNGGGVATGDINNDGLSDIFFSANQQKNHLYLNKGNLQFEDISVSAGIEGNSTWNTGVVMVDVNRDGWLDIYVTAVVGIHGFSGSNELFINNKDNTFTESAAEYNLDIQAYGTTSAFLDYDLDGDLDLYLLNHAVHTQESFGRSEIRLKRDERTGDRLMRNDGGRFTDVSEEAGIYGGPNGYGLGVAVSDFNQDGYPDIYVGNDFHEDDYFYINNRDGTFSEQLKNFFGHTTRFSMGNDVADLNFDGLPDLISLDMLPGDDAVIKASEGDDMYQTMQMRTGQFGYHYQFTRNMLFLNQAAAPFRETALLDGVAATDWSWSALFGDYDQDGFQDVFISNGIPKRPNNLDFIRFLSNDQIKTTVNNSREIDQKALDLMPGGEVANCLFQGGTERLFTDVSNKWTSGSTSVSGATAQADLDNDGDLDIVTNNLNAPAVIYENTTDGKNNYLSLEFVFNNDNQFGIGVKAFLYLEGKLHFRELYTARGFQASSQPRLHFGLGQAKTVDSLKIVWPDNSYQVSVDIQVNQNILVTPQNTKSWTGLRSEGNKKPMFQKVEGNLGITFDHRAANGFEDFNRQKLLPYQVSDVGPALAIGDLNADGKDDLYFGGGKDQLGELYLQRANGFERALRDTIRTESSYAESTAAIIDTEQENMLVVGSAGGDLSSGAKWVRDQVYRLNKEVLNPSESLSEDIGNTRVIAPFDYDSDGDTDLFIGSHATINDFGKITPSYLLKNESGIFEKVVPRDFEALGMVTDAIWDDFDGDGLADLIVVGEWMSPVFFENDSGELKKVELIAEELNGLWQSIHAFDIDQDGDQDYVLGNWGLNSKFSASTNHPMLMFYDDFDENGTSETVLAIEKNGMYYPLLGLDELAAQMVFLRKRFTDYKGFAGKTIEDIFSADLLDKADRFEVHTLASGFLRNTGDGFVFEEFGSELQLAPVTALYSYDFDADGRENLIMGGNYFGVIPFHGRFDSFPGAILNSESDYLLGHEVGLEMMGKEARKFGLIKVHGQPYLIISYFNEDVDVYEIINH